MSTIYENYGAMKATDTGLMTTKEAAAFLRCTWAALVKFRTERRGPPYMRIGRLVRYEKCDLLEWARSLKVRPGRIDAGAGVGRD